ncbi:P-type ATPase [Candidatus Mycolicibacterium alkanivorans]|uniref:P-type ATPase n=1 Tax=Candidatus Mycolicibacterium alkanivorans TaxID=2954114 RepID=UPI0035583A41
MVATGEDTELGSIAELIRTEAVGELPLQARMARFARVIGIAVLAASVIAFMSGLALGESAGHVFRVAVAMGPRTG